MKKITTLLICVAIGIIMITSSSCMKLLLKAMGEYKTPHPETPESILAYSQKNNFYYDYLYMPINDTALVQTMNHGYFSAGEIIPFNQHRHPIIISTQRNENGCPHVIAVAYQSQDTSIAVTLSDTLNFWNRLSTMQLIDKRQGLPDMTPAIQDYDYYIIGTWIKMFPKVSKNVHADFCKAVAVDSTKRVCTISLNYDAKSGNRFFKMVNKQIKKAQKAEKAEKKLK